MFPELTNLLPQNRIRKLRYEYFIRLATVAVNLLIVVMSASVALLVPSYGYMNQQVGARQARLDSLAASLATNQGKEANVRLVTLTTNATYLARLATTPSVTAAMRAVLAVPRTGIVLTAFTFMPPSKQGPGRMSLSGTASTREALRAFHQALGELPFVTTADLPIGVYAKVSDIPFGITLVGPFTL